MILSYHVARVLGLLLLQQVAASAVFEIKLRTLYIDGGRTEDGKCCAGTWDGATCSGECRIFFTVCLSHFQTPIPQTLECTYGSHVTGIMTTDMVVIGQNVHKDPYIIQMPINFVWPGSYVLVIEAWHTPRGYKTSADPHRRIVRAWTSGVIHPSRKWQNGTWLSRTADLRYNYRIVCDLNYYGRGCARFCRSRNNMFGHYNCSGEGTRMCLDGWDGEFCDKAKCTDICNKSRGYCDKPYECKCRLGWRGVNCDDCVPYQGCTHGTCRDPWECVCEEGWSGSLCSVDNSYCESYSPCLNGGRCRHDPVSNFTCTCSRGFKGPTCQLETCEQSFCLHGGTCREVSDGRTCQCISGFHGKRCEYKELVCGEKTCLSNATCLRDGKNWKCLCPPGFTGQQCGQEVNGCGSSPCKHGGVCRRRRNGYSCACAEGFVGKDCESVYDACQNTTCLNEGTCYLVDQFTATCLCLDDFTGPRCEKPADPCFSVKCLNGGTCLVVDDVAAKCACPSGYRGSLCQTEFSGNTCDNAPCLNGGKCIFFKDSYVCVCESGFRGTFCDAPSASGQPSDSAITDHGVGAVGNIAIKLTFNFNIFIHFIIARTLYLEIKLCLL